MTTYESAGKARKQCPKCNLYVHARTSVCDCGHEFFARKTVVHERQYADAPSRGRKLCAGCQRYVGVRTHVCECGYEFRGVEKIAGKPQVKSYTERGPGRKQCQCKKYVGVRTLVCDCGYVFPVKSETPIVERPESADHKLAEAFGYGHYSVCVAPGEVCPVRLRGTDYDKVSEWADEVMVDTNSQRFYGRQAMQAWISRFYPRYVFGTDGMNPDFVVACASLDRYIAEHEEKYLGEQNENQVSVYGLLRLHVGIGPRGRTSVCSTNHL